MDDSSLLITLAIHAGSGLLLIVLGRKQRAGTLRRNWLAGLRTSATMASDDAWHDAHLATAGLIVAAGVVQLLAAAVVVGLRPSEAAGGAVILGAMALTIVLVLTAGVRGHRIAAETERRRATSEPTDT